MNANTNITFSATISLYPLFSYFKNQVSWVRRRDWHILSSGENLYTNDARFVATHDSGSSRFTLQIKFVQKRDHGVYECQVSFLSKIKFKY